MNKEAIVVILDVSPTMKKALGGADGEENSSRIQVAIDSVKMLIEQKLLYSTNCEMGVVLMGTQKTDNHLADQIGGGQYANVTTFRAIEKLNLDALRSVTEGIACEDRAATKGDMVDGLIVAMDMMARHCGTKKYKRRIFVITDGERETKYDQDDFKTIASSMNETDTRLNVITLDFCEDLDEEDDEEEEPKPKAPNPNETKPQQKNREFLVKLTNKVKGAIFPASVAMQIYQQFKKKEVSARSKFRGNLDLARNLKLAVQIFSRTREETFPTLKKQSLVATESASAKDGLVKLDRSYAEVDDPDQAPVDPEKHTKAFQYGKQLVPVGKENEGVLKYKGGKKDGDEDENATQGGGVGDVQVQGDYERQFKLLGFTDQSKVPRHHFLGGVDIILPVRGAKNERAFAAMVNAMIEGHKVLIAKIIERKNADPKLVVLYPHISKKKPILYMVQLPTAEDLRDYQFPSLVPASEEQRTAARELIKALDLTRADPETGDTEERLKPELTFNPALQYFGQVVTHRIANPPEVAGTELPPLNQAVADYVRPDKELFEEAKDEVSAFEEAFPLQPVNDDENRKRQRVYWRDLIQREEQKNAEEAKQAAEEARVAAMKDKANAENGMLPGGPDQEVKEITSVDPIGDFKKMVNDRKVDRVNDAIVQMAAIIERFVKNSLKGDLYEKAIQCLQELRATCIKEDEGGRYNEFLHRIKKMFMTGTWSDFYQLLCANGKHLSLVTHRETPTSSFVTDEESVKFLQVDQIGAGRVPEVKKPVEDDLMDEIE
ncbi:hypothetical protein FGO68_gene16167 [Halteria grandinella]|uniref:VWFA domain-containing protein n=1 Tax=Halteria grandinella TaxID=5974 RepID=A0A8J8NFA2_HALGN|nr:hypothetical protein FGO68_gene16167 [Halteria grandinella]